MTTDDLTNLITLTKIIGQYESQQALFDRYTSDRLTFQLNGTNLSLTTEIQEKLFTVLKDHNAERLNILNAEFAGMEVITLAEQRRRQQKALEATNNKPLTAEVELG